MFIHEAWRIVDMRVNDRQNESKYSTEKPRKKRLTHDLVLTLPVDSDTTELGGQYLLTCG